MSEIVAKDKSRRRPTLNASFFRDKYSHSNMDLVCLEGGNMSTNFASTFGEEHGNEYGRIVNKWSKRLVGVNEIDQETFQEWGKDLQEVLGEQVKEALLNETVKEVRKSGGKMPSKELFDMYADIAVKGALATDTGDLLERLRISANEHLTAAFSPAGLAKRAFLTVAQIFDMAQDRFKRLANNFTNRTRETPRRRIWETHSGPDSRHASLDGVVKEEDEMFEYNGQEVYGPRPPGGSPADWSNCSCEIRYLN
jgi:hypothetical protein